MKYHINTQCLHSGYTPKNGEARVLPITQSTTFCYESAQAMGQLFDLEADGFFYTRLANPTADAVEKKIADMEGGVAALLTSSGQSAVFIAVSNIARSGDHVICVNSVYGGTFNLFHKTLKEAGIEFVFVPPDADEAFLHAQFKPNTRLVFSETLTNPSLVVLDIEKFANVAHAHKVPLIIDNTFATPVNCRPFEFGADIVVHSTSKYMDGHACALGGVIVDGGRFDWAASGLFPELTTPDESYHGTIYTEKFGAAAYIAKARLHLMRDFGATPAPMNAFLLNLGLETLPLRMERHCSNALEIAQRLEIHAKIAWINFPGLPSCPHYDLAQKYLPNGSCGVVSFGIKGGRAAAVQFMDSLRLASIVTHVADVRTCVLHPASTTHRQLSDTQLLEAGVPPDLIRMSVGLEHIADIWSDIEQALSKVS